MDDVRHFYLCLTESNSKLRIVITMKIRFLKTTAVDIETMSGEIYDKAFNRWDELENVSVFDVGMKYATIKTENGEILHGVPVNSFEKLSEVKRAVTL